MVLRKISHRGKEELGWVICWICDAAGISLNSRMVGFSAVTLTPLIIGSVKGLQMILTGSVFWSCAKSEILKR